MNVLKTIELYTLNGCTVCELNLNKGGIHTQPKKFQNEHPKGELNT